MLNHAPLNHINLYVNYEYTPLNYIYFHHYNHKPLSDDHFPVYYYHKHLNQIYVMTSKKFFMTSKSWL